MGKEGPRVMGFLEIDLIGPARQALKALRDVRLKDYVPTVITHKYLHMCARARAVHTCM